MSKQARRFSDTRKRPIDRVIHPKSGRRKGEKLRVWMDMAKNKKRKR